GIGWTLNEVALAWIHERVPRDTPPLPDLWFSWFPEVRGAIRITEYIMIILVVNAVVVKSICLSKKYQTCSPSDTI
ncbi:hypothetical protein OSTOST_22955, partial [Ostertagia ostertagi]